MKVKGLGLSLIGTGAVALLSTSALGAPSPAGTARYDESVVPHSSRVQVIGEAAAQSVVQFQVALKLRDADGLTRKNHDGVVQTYAQLEAQHLPTAADYGRVVAWLKASGFTIQAVDRSRLSIQASGTAAQVGRVMGVGFSAITAEGRSLVSANNAPHIPAALTDVVQSINGLQPELRARKLNRRAAAHPNAGTGDMFGYPASTFVSAYNAEGYTRQGHGSITAIVIDTFPNRNDLIQYWKLTNTPQRLSNISFIQAGPLPNDPPEGEESLDTEVSSSIAPKSMVRVYASGNLQFTSLDTTFQKVIDDLRNGIQIDQVSISLGACETDVPRLQEKTDDNYFAVLSSLGASVFVSSGDSGSDTCSSSTPTPSFFSTSPNVTAVGGTALTVDTTSSSPYSETAWDGSGGGVSFRFKTPNYQKTFDYQRRAVPDVSADADPNTGALVILDGAPIQVGGTSLSAPIWAGLMALVNAERHRLDSQAGVGLINRYTTKLVSTANFRDVTEGSNGAYNAAPGFDLVTGVGSPLMDKLGPKLESKK